MNCSFIHKGEAYFGGCFWVIVDLCCFMKMIPGEETDVGGELPQTSFDVTHSSLVAVKVDMF